MEPVYPLTPRVDSAESESNFVLQGKPPSDEHLLKLCTDVLRSKYLFEFMSFCSSLKVPVDQMLQTVVSEFT